MNNNVVETKILARVAGEEGMEAVVAQISYGYSVALFDADAEAYLPVSKVFPTLDAAMAYAYTVVPATALEAK
jgi:hypothetical protein